MIKARPFEPHLNYYLEAAAGRVPGLTIGNFFGYIPDIDPGDGFISFWDEREMVKFPDVAGPVYISSESAADAGTFFGVALDADYIEHQVIATLDGQNAVQMLNLNPAGTNDFLWVNSAVNVGVVPSVAKIYISTTNVLSGGKPDDTSTIIGIVFYDSSSSMSHEVMSNGALIVPGNKTMYTNTIRRFIGKNKDADINLEVQPFSLQFGVHTVPLVIAAFEIFQVNAGDMFAYPAKLEPKTRVRFTARTDTSNTTLSMDLSFVYENI